MTAAAAAALALAGAAGFWGARAAIGAFHPRSDWFGPVLSRGVPNGPDDHRVALTFDDGPHEVATGRILDILAERNIRAAFFVIGRYVDQRPELIRRMLAEGHLVGNHTYDHHRAGLFYWNAYWRDQIERCSAAIQAAAAGVAAQAARPRWFRPPMGFKSRFNMRAAASAGLTTLTWSRRARDGFAAPAAAIVRRLEAVRPGDIVLLHDGVEPAARRTPDAVVEALPAILDSLARRRLHPVRADELLGLGPP